MITDSSYRWVVVAYTLLIQAVSIGIQVYCFALFAVPWLEEFGAPRRDVMLAVSLQQVGVGLVSPFVGRAIDRYPMQRIVLTGLALLVAGLVMVSQARALWQIHVVYATVLPLGLAMTSNLPAQTLVTRWFLANRGVAIGISAAGTNLGGVLFPLLVAGWLALWGWRETMLGLALLSLVLVAPLTLLLLRRQPPKPAAAPAAGSLDGRIWSSREILATPMFWIPVLAIIPMITAFGAVQFNLGAFSQDLGFDADTAAGLLALSSVCMILGKFLFGALGDLLDHRKIYWISAALMVASLVVLQGRPSLWQLAVGVACLGAAGGGILPLMAMIFGARFGIASFGRVMGLVMLSFTLTAVGPLLAGWAHDLTGSYDAAFTAFIVLLLPVVIAMRWLPAPGSGAHASVAQAPEPGREDQSVR